MGGHTLNIFWLKHGQAIRKDSTATRFAKPALRTVNHRKTSQQPPKSPQSKIGGVVKF